MREAAAQLGGRLFIIAKIERADALQHYDEILQAADGIMVARGDLGVEVPIEEIAFTQKQLIAKANLAGKPVITATQMLESMVASRLPPRAEATDVANAILDGTDCVMLSGESAMGKFPEEAVTMLARIAAFTESRRPRQSLAARRELLDQGREMTGGERMGLVVENALETVPCDAVLAPALSGATSRIISRSKPPVWIIAPSRDAAVCQGLAFSYGVHAVDVADEDEWQHATARFVHKSGIAAERVLLVAGPSPKNPKANHRIELMRFDANEIATACGRSTNNDPGLRAKVLTLGQIRSPGFDWAILEDFEPRIAPHGIPPAKPWNELAEKKRWTPAQLKKAQEVRGKLNVPHERFQIGAAGEFFWAGK